MADILNIQIYKLNSEIYKTSYYTRNSSKIQILSTWLRERERESERERERERIKRERERERIKRERDIE